MADEFLAAQLAIGRFARQAKKPLEQSLLFRGYFIGGKLPVVIRVQLIEERSRIATGSGLWIGGRSKPGNEDHMGSDAKQANQVSSHGISLLCFPSGHNKQPTGPQCYRQHPIHLTVRPFVSSGYLEKNDYKGAGEQSLVAKKRVVDFRQPFRPNPLY